MDNSGVSESTEISHEIPDTQHTSGVATSERNNEQTVQDIENQIMQEVVVKLDPPIVTGASFNQQQHPVQDIENSNLEESPISLEQEAAIRASFIITGDDDSKSEDVESMYRAALEGNWANAEKLLNKDPTLASKWRSGYLPNNETEEKFYRPLHVAIALKHDKFVLNLIERMKPSELSLLDSYFQTACSYAAALGKLDIIKAMIKRHPKLLEECVETCAGLAFYAAFSGKSEVISFFLERTHELGPCWKDLWLGLLQNTIGNKMYGVALRVLDKYVSVAIESDEEEGTALHFLARQDISAASTAKTTMIFRSIFGTTIKETRTMAMSFIWKIYNKFYIKFNNKDVNIYDSGWQDGEEMPKDFRRLAQNLLHEIQKLKNKPEVLDLLNDPPILHDAAKVGNVDLIRMITHAYPDLIWQTDKKTKRTLFHIAIECREANVFSFVQRFGFLDLNFLFQTDEDINTILHSAAKLGPRKIAIPALQMQSELAWFKAVKAMLPVWFIDMENKDGKTPRALFDEKHAELFEESKKWMKSTANSCMLIATIILTVVYAAAFTVPGGTSEATGLPILVKSNWLTCFFIFEALALFCSTLCIITFWSITCSGFEQDQFLYVLPYQLRLGFTALFGSLIGAISAFLSAYHMVLVEGKAWLVKSCLLSIYVLLVLAICGRFSELWNKTKLPECLPQMMSKGNSLGGPNPRKAN